MGPFGTISGPRFNVRTEDLGAWDGSKQGQNGPKQAISGSRDPRSEVPDPRSEGSSPLNGSKNRESTGPLNDDKPHFGSEVDSGGPGSGVQTPDLRSQTPDLRGPDPSRGSKTRNLRTR